MSETTTADYLAGLAGISARRIQQMAEEGVIPKGAKRNEYPKEEAIRAVVQYYKDLANSHTAERSADRARRERAEADSAEMDAEKKRGTLMYTADARRLWADGFAKIRDAIARSGLSAADKKAVSDAIQKIKLEDAE